MLKEVQGHKLCGLNIPPYASPKSGGGENHH